MKNYQIFYNIKHEDLKVWIIHSIFDTNSDIKDDEKIFKSKEIDNKNIIGKEVNMYTQELNMKSCVEMITKKS